MDTSTWAWLVPVAGIAAWHLYKRLTQVSPAEGRRLVNDGAMLIDVRTPGEFASGHLPGAINLPLAELSAGKAQLGSPQRPVVVYCASGTRSAVARSILRRQGFPAVFNLGSMRRWGPS